jgi:antitoxin component of MazEF toxin-antitoxin module
MRKSLSSVGSSLGVIIDKPILEALGITRATILDLSIEGGAIVLRPAPRRTGSSHEELEDWARSLLVRVSATSDDVLPDDLVAELERLEQTLPLFIEVKSSSVPRTRSSVPSDARAWLQQIVHELNARRPPSPRPILTRQVALEVLEELADARGTFREITAARPFANASPDVVAGVLWFLLTRGYVEVHADSHTIRPTLEHLRRQGRIPEHAPESIAESFKEGVTLLRLTPLGGDHLHELRKSERGERGSRFA